MIARIDQTSGDVLAGGKRYIPFMLAIANDAGSVKKKKKKKKKGDVFWLLTGAT